MTSKGVSLPDSDLSEEAIYDLEAPSVSECVDILDPTSGTHDQIGSVTPFSSLSDPDPDLNASRPRAVSGASALLQPTKAKPGAQEDDNTSYISRGSADVLEKDVAGNVIDLKSDDILHDVVTDQVNIAIDPDTESTPEIIGIADHQWNSGTLELLCLYDSGETEWHPFDLVQADDPKSLSNYIDRNDVGNSAQAQIIKRWSRVFKRALRRVFKRCVKSNCFRFYSGSYHPTPKALRSRRVRKARREKFGDEASAEALAWPPVVSSRKATKYEYGIEVPRNWGDVLRIDAKNGDYGCQEAV